MTLRKWKRPSGMVTNGALNSLFNDFFADDMQWGRNTNQLAAVNILEDGNSYGIEMNAPGFEKADFNVELDGDLLKVTAEHHEDSESTEQNYIRKEFGYRSINRTFQIPETVDAKKIQLKYDNGILKIVLPKKEEMKKQEPKKLKVS